VTDTQVPLFGDEPVPEPKREQRQFNWPSDKKGASAPPSPGRPATPVDLAPPPPTGPKVEVFTATDGQPAAYLAWRGTEEGSAYWEQLVAEAHQAFAANELRFSTRTHLAYYRDQRHIRINDHFSPWLADDLVTAFPQLLDIVERRARKKAGPETRQGEE